MKKRRASQRGTSRRRPKARPKVRNQALKSLPTSDARVRMVHQFTDLLLSLSPIRSADRSAASEPLGGLAAGMRAAVASSKRVTFTCTNFPTVIVTISTHVGAILLQPGGALDMPVGNNDLVWAARGTAGAPFDVTVAGGSLDEDISGPLPAGGPRILTVA